MCAIFGIGLMNGHRIVNMGNFRLILDVLLKQSQSRGRNASGLAFVTKQEIAVVKHGIPASELIDTNVYHDKCDKYLKEEAAQLLSVVGHCRAQTKGTYKNNDNNHPIVAGRVVGVHNGHINNDDQLFQDYQKFGGNEWVRIGQVDSEVIFRLLNYYIHARQMETTEAVIRTADALTGGFACAFVTAMDKYCIWLFRNTAPTEVAYFPALGVIMFSSSMTYIRNSLEGINMGPMETVEMPQHSAMCIDLFHQGIIKFNLQKPAKESVKLVPRNVQQAGVVPGLLPPKGV